MAVEYMLAVYEGDAPVDEQAMKIPRTRRIETNPHRRLDQQADEMRPHGHLHQQ